MPPLAIEPIVRRNRTNYRKEARGRPTERGAGCPRNNTRGDCLRPAPRPHRNGPPTAELGDAPREPADGDNPGRAEGRPGAPREAALARLAAEDQLPARQESRTASWSDTRDNRPDGSRAHAPADGAQPDHQQPPDNPAEKTRPGHPDLRDRYPADYKLTPDVPPPRIDGPHESPERWADAINPDKQAEARKLNCGDCARSVDSTWHGFPAVAAAIDYPRLGGEFLPRMTEWAGMPSEPSSMADIEEHLSGLGPGSSAVVACYWKTGRGHWFNAVNDSGTVKAVDGQSGMVETWPPTLEKLQYDESQMRHSRAIFFTSDGKVVRHDHQ